MSEPIVELLKGIVPEDWDPEKCGNAQAEHRAKGMKVWTGNWEAGVGVSFPPDPAELSETLWKGLATLKKFKTSSPFEGLFGKHGSDHEQRIQRLEKLVKDQGEAIAALQGEAVLPPPSQFEQWIDSPAAQEFAGKHIAYLEGQGVVSSSESIKALAAEIKDHPLRKQIILDFIPSGSY